MEKQLFIGACGDVCSECPRYIATANNDINELAALAKLWYRTGFRDQIVSVQEIQCRGCSKTKSCANEINHCIFLEKKETCGECERFPCQKLQEVFSKSKKFESICQNKCTTEEFRKLHQAFFRKQEVLQEISRNKQRE